MATGLIGLAPRDREPLPAIRKAHATRRLTNVGNDAHGRPLELRSHFPGQPSEHSLVRDHASKRPPRNPVNIESLESKSIVLHRGTSFAKPGGGAAMQNAISCQGQASSVASSPTSSVTAAAAGTLLVRPHPRARRPATTTVRIHVHV